MEPYVLSASAFESHTGMTNISDNTLALQEGDEALPNWPSKRRVIHSVGLLGEANTRRCRALWAGEG